MSENFDPITGKRNETPVTVGEWIGTMLLLLIPLVNIIMMFVWAFGGGTKVSKSNYFKAALIMTLIGIVLSIVLSILFGTLLMPMFQDWIDSGAMY